LGREIRIGGGQNLKIVHVIIGLNIGGAELALMRLVKSHYGNANYQHAVISLTEPGAVGAQMRALGIEVYAMGMRSAVEVPYIMWRLVRLIRALRPGVVQTWMYHGDLLGGLAARLAGCNSVIWGIRSSDLAGSGARSTEWVRALCAALSHRIPRFIVCVAEASRRIHVALGYRADRMVVIQNGFDLAQLHATNIDAAVFRSACGFSVDDVVVGSLGRFNHDKDQHNFVRAASLVGLQFPQVRFLMVGRNCDSNNMELMAWIGAAGLSDRFVLLGERSDVLICLAAMDVFCLSSRSEAFPNVVGEAMGMGIPCVVTDVGDVAMLVADTGVVVPRENSVALAFGLGRLLAMTADERQMLGLRARARVYAEFSMDRTRERFESIYQRIARKERT